MFTHHYCYYAIVVIYNYEVNNHAESNEAINNYYILFIEPNMKLKFCVVFDHFCQSNRIFH